MDAERFLEELRAGFILRGGVAIPDSKLNRMPLKEILRICECNRVDLSVNLPDIKK